MTMTKKFTLDGEFHALMCVCVCCVLRACSCICMLMYLYVHVCVYTVCVSMCVCPLGLCICHACFNANSRWTHTSECFSSACMRAHTHTPLGFDKLSTQTEQHAHTRHPPHPSHSCLCWQLSAHPLTLTLRQRHIHINKETPLCPLATHANIHTHAL